MSACRKRWPLLRVVVAERSMLPALYPGDWLLAYRTARIRPGQVVLAWHPQRPGFLLVKRAVWREDGGWWLASDNPAAGAVDSARFGPVPAEKIVARVLVRYRPVRRRRPRSWEPAELHRIWEYRRRGLPVGCGNDSPGHGYSADSQLQKNGFVFQRQGPAPLHSGAGPWSRAGLRPAVIRGVWVGQCRGCAGASPIREDCSSTSRSTSWRGSLAHIAQ